MVQMLKAFKLVTLCWSTLYFKSYRVTSIANKTTLYVGIAIRPHHTKTYQMDHAFPLRNDLCAFCIELGNPPLINELSEPFVIYVLIRVCFGYRRHVDANYLM